MLDAVAGEDDAPVVVHPDRDGEHDRPLRIAQPLGDGLGDVRVRQGLLVLRDRRREERRVPLEVGLGRGFLDRRHGGSVVVEPTTHDDRERYDRAGAKRPFRESRESGSARIICRKHAGGGSRTRTAGEAGRF